MKFLSNGGEMNDPVKNIHFNSKHVGKMRDFSCKNHVSSDVDGMITQSKRKMQ